MISGLILLVFLLILSMTVSRFVVENRSAFIGIMVLIGLFVVGSINVEGFSPLQNVKAMLLFASFLGLACVGQDPRRASGWARPVDSLRHRFGNVGLLYLIGLGVPPWLAVIIIIVLGLLVGVLNGFLSYRLQGQALIVTLGVGFAVSGLTQIITSIGSSFAGNVFGTVPDWLKKLAAMNGTTFGLPFPPVIGIWIAVAILLIVGMRKHGVRPLSLRTRRHPHVGAAGLDLRAALLGRRLLHFRRRLGDDRCAAPGLERRRLHRRRPALSVHDTGRGGCRRDVAARRRGGYGFTVIGRAGCCRS